MASCKYLPALLLVSSLVNSCISTDLPPFGSGGKAFQVEEDEKQLWQTSAQFQQRLEKAGVLFDDPSLESYLDGVAAKLLRNRLAGTGIVPRVKVVKDPFLNAFALSDGAIYFHTGILARMENEAQLATILGHELAHFINRHAIKEMRNKNNRLAAARVLQVVLVGSIFGAFAEPLPTLWAAASVSGYSKELETQADEEGLRLMVEAGYDPKESVRIFERFQQDRDESKFKEPFFFGTHPRVQERIENHVRLLQNGYQSAAQDERRLRNSEEFPNRIHRLLLDNAMLDLDLGRFKIARAAIERHLQHQPDSARGHFLMGELYRRSGRTDEAVKAYRQAVSLDPDFPEVHRELGLLYRAGSRPEEARTELKKYLAINPQAIDGPIIRGFIQESQAP
jgi:predicted Zn-dependent protease